jgi:hypothetical protein
VLLFNTLVGSVIAATNSAHKGRIVVQICPHVYECITLSVLGYIQQLLQEIPTLEDDSTGFRRVPHRQEGSISHQVRGLVNTIKYHMLPEHATATPSPPQPRMYNASVNIFYFLATLVLGYEDDTDPTQPIKHYPHTDATAIATGLGNCIATTLQTYYRSLDPRAKAQPMPTAPCTIDALRSVNVIKLMRCVWRAVEAHIRPTRGSEEVYRSLQFVLPPGTPIGDENEAPSFTYASRSIRTNFLNHKAKKAKAREEQATAEVTAAANSAAAEAALLAEPEAKVAKVAEEPTDMYTTNLELLTAAVNDAPEPEPGIEPIGEVQLLETLVLALNRSDEHGLLCGESQMKIIISMPNPAENTVVEQQQPESYTLNQVNFVPIALICERLVLETAMNRAAIARLAQVTTMSNIAREILLRTLNTPTAKSQMHGVDASVLTSLHISPTSYDEIERDPTQCQSMLLLFAALTHYVDMRAEQYNVIHQFSHLSDEDKVKIYANTATPMHTPDELDTDVFAL